MLEIFTLVLAGVTLPAVAVTAVQLIRGHRRLARLDEIQRLEGRLPPLSVVVPARNEEKELETTLRSLLDQDYPDLQIIAVDDRSVDATGTIIDRLTREEPRLVAIHVEDLPSGWLGKVHALAVGVEAAGGEILLFTDADVRMRPDALRLAVGHMEREGLDHLTAAARIDAPGPLIDLAVGAFALMVNAFGQPWKAADPTSERYAGLGTFNMVRAQALLAIGGLRRIRMHPVDDVALGREIKRAGLRQEMVLGRDLIRVEWYGSARELVRGLRKNGFAAAEYSLAIVAAISAVILLVDVWPWAALGLTGGVARWLNLGIVAGRVLSYAYVAPHYGLRWWLAPVLPLGALILLYTGLASAASTLLKGGITWRGTFYPLRELRRASEADSTADDRWS